MKKRYYLVFLLIICVSVCLSFAVKQNFSSASAVDVVSFTCSTDSNGNVSVSKNGASSSNYQNWKSALSYINQNSLGYGKIKISFNNFDLSKISNEYIYFDSSDFEYYLTGKIISNYKVEPILITSTESVGLILEDIEFDCSNSKYAINMNNGNYNDKHSLKFGKEIIYNSQFFTLYNKNCRYDVTENPLESILKIVLPHDLLGEYVVYYNNSYDLDKIVLCTVNDSEDDSYYITSDYNASVKCFIASSYVKINFDLNGGQTEKELMTNLIYFMNQNFLTEDDVTKYESNFMGWYGKLEYNSVVYYFDASMLESFSREDYNFDKIGDCFVTSIDDTKLQKANSFTGFTYSDETFIRHKHLDFFIENNIIASYVAKWELKKYTIDFVTNDENIEVLRQENAFDSNIILSDLTGEKEGYTFLGWYLDSKCETPFELTKMPSKNIVLYAGWQINTYDLTIVSADESETYTFDYGYDLSNLLEPSERYGYNFIGYYLDTEYLQEYNLTTMPAQNLTLYVLWQLKEYKVYFFLSGGKFSDGRETSLDIVHGECVVEPNINPTKTGYEFLGWYTYIDSDELFDFSQPISSPLGIYAKWKAIVYKITFEGDGIIDGKMFSEVEINEVYDANLEEYKPVDPILSGYNFDGWFEKNTEIKFLFDKMPAKNVILCAKWIEKKTIDFITLDDQNYDYEARGAMYSLNQGEFDNFLIYYKLHDSDESEWSRVVPTKVGVYDIKVERVEDDEYKAFFIEKESAYIINRIQKNFSWLILLLSFGTLVEVVVILLIERMRRVKISNTYSVAIGEVFFISNGQLAGVIISGLLFIAGFVYLIYELVMLSRTTNNENFEASKQDNRERFKEDLVFQRNVVINPNYVSKTKTDDSFGDKYSSADIEKMLQNDDFADNLNKAKDEKIEKDLRKMNISSEENGSDKNDTKTDKKDNLE